MLTSVFVNDNIISHTEGRGVTRVLEKHLDGIVAGFGEATTIFSSLKQPHKPARRIRALPRAVGFRGSSRLRLNWLLQRANDQQAAWYIQRLKPAVVYSPYCSFLQTSRPQIYVIHDMIYEMFPQYFSYGRPEISETLAQRKHCIEQAATLIAVSQNTANDILKSFPNISPTKVKVIPHGVDRFFFEGQQQSFEGKPYFLYVGHRSGYKNFLRLLTAFGQSGLATSYDLRVISPTLNTFSPAEVEVISKYKLQAAVHLLTGVSDMVLRRHYNQATAFIYPSEYEGFGLSILEAMASGTLVATSNVSSMPEVGGSVAYYFDPLDEAAISEVLVKLANLSDAERQQKIIAGIAHAQTFTWERCQNQVVEILRQFV